MDITSCPQPGTHLPARSWRPDETMRLSLGGRWRFLLSGGPAVAPTDAHLPATVDDDWSEIEVPGHWALQGHGKPIYTNVAFPIPLDPPFVPDLNPTGDHRTWFEVPAEWEADRLLLRFDGVESAAEIHLNGEWVGRTSGSRLPGEFDVTELLVPGRNLLHVRVHQWSANTYLEDQDQWWLAGIFRDVSLIGRPAGGIDDVWLDVDLDPVTGVGIVRPWLRCDADAFPVSLAIDELGVMVTWQDATEVTAVEVGRVEPWSPEVPRLYSARVVTDTEDCRLRLGFRRVSIEGNRWLVNGRPLRLRGVNRHEFHPRTGRVFDPVDARAGLELMKRNHINAIRTSHYPPDPRLLEMCDELGFWVVNECDLETHGFELDGWRLNPSNDPRWRKNMVDRMVRTVERDKNHPSVICWSLGNESGTGANLAHMAAFARRRDPGRPVHYEGDHEGAYTDVVSQMYTPLQAMREMSRGEGDGLTAQPGAMARLVERPMMLCEYGHAMGDGPGALNEYDEAFDLPGWHGGFVWEWRDHGLEHRLPDGTVAWYYGGDFGEEVHDGSFVCDGLVLPDGTPSAALAELAAVNAPLRLAVAGEELQLTNRFFALDTSVADVTFRILTSGVAGPWTPLEVPLTDAGEACSIPLALPAVAALDEWLEVRALSNEAFASHQRWALEPVVLGSVQVQRSARERRPGPGPGPMPRTEGAHVLVGAATLDATTGRLLQLGALPVSQCHVELWRAPTENDRLTTHGSYELADPFTTHGLGVPGPSSAQRWRDAGLDRLCVRTLQVAVEQDAFTVIQRMLPAQGTTGVECSWRWTATVAGTRLQLDVVPVCGAGVNQSTWPRVGIHLALPGALAHARWYGLGPGQAYPDSRQAARLGIWESPVRELADRTVVPQESGHRADLRWLEMAGSAGTVGSPALRVEAVGGTFGFVAGAHDVHEVTRAAHHHELEPDGATHLYLDAAQHGLGSRSCGPDVLPRYQLWPRHLGLDILFASGAVPPTVRPAVG